MSWVIDCSFSAALFLPDEYSDVVKEFFLNLKNNEKLIISPLWWYEFSNVLTVSVRRNRLNHTDILHIISLFEQIGIETDNYIGAEHSKEIYKISQQYMISAYDATYLELAIRKKASIASLDKKLFTAAKDAGLSIVKL